MSGLIERGVDQTAEKMTLAHNFLTLHFMLEQVKANSKSWGGALWRKNLGHLV